MLRSATGLPSTKMNKFKHCAISNIIDLMLDSIVFKEYSVFLH